MHTVKRLDLSSLDEKTRKAYEALTLPKFHCCLEMKNPDGTLPVTIIAIAVILQEEPVGLLLASFYPKTRQTEVHSYYIVEPHRHQRLGTELFQALEREVSKLGGAFILIRYPTWEAYTPYVEHILKRLGWTPPVRTIIHLHFDANTIRPKVPIWLKKEVTYSPELTPFLWKDLTSQEKMEIFSQLVQGKFHYSVSPLKKEENIEYGNSLGLRYKNKLVGWMITHRENAETIRYFALYIDPQYQLHADAIKLLCDALWRQEEMGVRFGLFDVNIQMTTPKWINFVQRRLIPLATSITYTNISYKHLNQ